MVTCRSGAATSVSVSMAVLFSGVGSGPLVPSSRTLASLVISVTPAGTVLSTSTVTVSVTLAPAARLPTSSVTTSPSRLPLRRALTKVVCSGRMSVTTTPVAS